MTKDDMQYGGGECATEDEIASSMVRADEVPVPADYGLTQEADRLIERWTERQAVRGEQATATAQEPASAPAPAPTAPGVQVQRLETFPWKGLLWQVVGFANVIPDGEENATQSVIIRPLAPVASGWSRAERRAARRAGQKVRG